MRIYLHVACAALPILLGLAMGEATVAAMPASNAYSPPPALQDRYTMGQSWAAKHRLDDARFCPAIDIPFQSGCIAVTRY
jgi:hypothetical protein